MGSGPSQDQDELHQSAMFYAIRGDHAVGTFHNLFEDDFYSISSSQHFRAAVHRVQAEMGRCQACSAFQNSPASGYPKLQLELLVFGIKAQRVTLKDTGESSADSSDKPVDGQTD